tara:strand:- start:672 stop:1238 length:567 start_codon:yes stop_codon:yes gene_type:complete
MKESLLAVNILLLLCINVFSDEIILKIENNWNQIDTMSGQFKQKDSDGITSYGNFYFLKPYQSKFVYNDRTENIITNESLLVIVDDDNYKIDSYSIGNNILKKLLSDDLSIYQQFDLVKLDTRDSQYILQLKIKNNNESKLNVTFDKDTLDIKKWEIYDEFQNKTVLEFTKIKKNIFISQNLFVVKYR